jgi:hypothetical protein
MSRALTGATTTALLAAAKTPIIFFEAQITGGFIRVWSGYGTITWNALSWTGIGDLGGVSSIGETSDVTAQGIQVSLSGCNTALVSDAIAQVQRGYSGKVWLGFLDSSGLIIADPYQAFAGRLDQPEINPDPASPNITISYENRLIDLERPRLRMFTPQDQKIDFPNDLGFDYVTSIQEWNGKWGSV